MLRRWRAEEFEALVGVGKDAGAPAFVAEGRIGDDVIKGLEAVAVLEFRIGGLFHLGFSRAGFFSRQRSSGDEPFVDIQNVLHAALLEQVISRALKKALEIKLLICIFHICTIQLKKTYRIADRTRSSEP